MFWFGFVSLNEEEKVQRRILLNQNALIAQLSAIGAIVAIKTFLYLVWLAKRPAGVGKEDTPEPSSPHAKFQRSRSPWSVSSWRLLVRRLEWWLSGEFVIGWGTRGQWILAGWWTVWLLYLSIRETGNDYLHMTKRLGLVGASQLPLHYLLVMKSRFSPLALIFNRSHEELNWIHQYLGRILSAMFLAHAGLYLNFFVQAGVLEKRLQDDDVLSGLMAIAVISVIGLSALGYVRMLSYRTFYWIHVILGGYLLLVLYSHVVHIQIYIIECAVISMLNVALRWTETSHLSGTVSVVGTTGLIRVEMALGPVSQGQGSSREWQPGQHVYISSKSSRWFNLVPGYLSKNPFTICNISSSDAGGGSIRQMTLIARCQKGATKQLAEKSKLSPAPIPFRVEGPYGSSHRYLEPARLRQYSSVLIVAGGVGGTYAVPMWVSMIRRSETPSRARFVWAVRSMEEAVCVFGDALTDSKGPDLYVTGERSGQAAVSEESGDYVELQEMETSLPGEAPSGGLRGVTMRRGRPSLGVVVSASFSGASNTVCVIVCGPKGMVRDVRQEVSEWVDNGYAVDFHAEFYGL
ncbi:hypothetical protein P152DRAFT_478951 [Eremomyces bilateralis CBS 781.70]|uniref:FAD-binding FR-type domain-containing protein n=1 Tax=Eremomyces bilateralis CBS 781.70 TaxID=1392243 RepID=A0A6G1GE74_9PEZI|nr:uncharacterized protein P152DRAFT_478951 [Eremomyces bilateralis CBS 781.70]KAF1816405.1 hypothetical protein P152DRAFT_478951 [Eremomyces bilateralis CBS 781.70]